MDKLNEFYKSQLRTLTIFLAALAIFIVKVIIPEVAKLFPSRGVEDLIFDSVAPGSILFGIVFLVSERFIRNYLWKWKFFHQDLDFSGEWLGTTYYAHLEVESPKVVKKDFSPFYSQHKINIEQDCIRIAIVPSPGNDFVNWGSIATALNDDGSLKFAYWVVYNDPRKFPDQARGYEEMKVLKRIHKKPILMSGFFSHCAEGQSPVYRGKTIFVRKGYENLIFDQDLPEFARSHSGVKSRETR